MKTLTKFVVLLAVAFCLCGPNAAATIVDLTFQGQFSYIFDYTLVSPEGILDSRYEAASGPATILVSVDVADADLVHTGNGSFGRWDFRGDVMAFTVSGEPTVEADELLENLSQGLGDVVESDSINRVEGTYFLDDSGYTFGAGYMSLSAYALGLAPEETSWGWGAAALAFFMEGASDTAGLNDFQGYFAQNYASFIEVNGATRQLEPDYSFSEEMSRTWSFEMTLADAQIRPVIPEPTSAVLLGLGLLVPLLRRLRKP